MTLECKSCGSNVESSAQFCDRCGSSKDAAENLFDNDCAGIVRGLTCFDCHVNLPPGKKRYLLMSTGGCIRHEREYCKECYKAKLIERAKWHQIDKEDKKIARARCNECNKPFTGIFRKKRYAIKGHRNMRNPTQFFCKDCFLALPKSDPWTSPPERITSDPSGESFFD